MESMATTRSSASIITFSELPSLPQMQGSLSTAAGVRRRCARLAVAAPEAAQPVVVVNQDVKGERAPEHLQLLAARRRELAYHTTQGPEPTLDSGLWRYGTWASRDAEEGCGQTRSHEGLRGAMGREGESSPRGPNTRSQRAAAAGGSKRAVMASPFSETPRRFLEGS